MWPHALQVFFDLILLSLLIIDYITMMETVNRKFSAFAVLLFLMHLAIGCNGPTNGNKQDAAVNENGKDTEGKPSPGIISENYKEGTDFILFERVRILDKTGFENRAEAYSLLLPRGWQEQSDVVWNTPGTACAGTFKWLKASSADKRFTFEMYPDLIYSWNSDPEMTRFNQNNQGSSPYCAIAEPMDAEQYLRNEFCPKELGNAEVIKVEANPFVVKEMEQGNDKARAELMRYGATQLDFRQTAVNATVRWPDNSEGLVVLGVNVLENNLPNVYTGGYTKIYTTQIAKRTVFRYPSGEKDQALNQFSVIMGSLRTNQAWSDMVNGYWKDVREKKHILHIGKLKMMDDQTRAIGEATIRKGQDRLNQMDTDLRSWEQRQSSQDRMHTNFIKTIREVENYQDVSGKVELSSAYDHAWSRGDGSTFIMSNSPNFDPSSVFQDQNWKEMKKVD